jgi:LysR family glycine cleavage system transcriptional activator
MFPAAFTPMCSPTYVERMGPLDTPADLLHLLRLNSDDVWWRSWFAQMGVDVDVDFDRRSIHVDSQVIEGMAAMAGEGVAMLTPSFWRTEVATGRLVQLFPHVGADSNFWLVYPEHRHNAPKVRAFREWLLAEIAATAGSD